MNIINKNTLLDLLKYVRPSDGRGELAFIDTLCKLVEELGYAYTLDTYGNIIVDNLPTEQTTSRVMFTSHTDSVHSADYMDKVEQELIVRGGYVMSNANCLGADDATGVYVMLNLLQAGVKGYYVFFRKEETGGIGSRGMRTQNAELLRTFTHCISFDRKGYDSIITHQFLGRCASDEFANHLADELSLADPQLTLSADPTGTFTDSANFSDVISECTNLSVGYFYQHTADERQDLVFIEQLCKALCKVDWLNLPHYRTPQIDPYYIDDEYFSMGYDTDLTTMVDYITSNPDHASELVYYYPDEAAQLILDLVDNFKGEHNV